MVLKSSKKTLFKGVLLLISAFLIIISIGESASAASIYYYEGAVIHTPIVYRAYGPDGWAYYNPLYITDPMDYDRPIVYYSYEWLAIDSLTRYYHYYGRPLIYSPYYPIRFYHAYPTYYRHYYNLYYPLRYYYYSYYYPSYYYGNYYYPRAYLFYP